MAGADDPDVNELARRIVDEATGGASPEVFSTTDYFGDEVVLTEEDVTRIDAKRGDDILAYADEIQDTLERPSIVYGGRHADSKVFYGKDRLPEICPFGGCYVAVIVRYSVVPASIRTVYFPFNIAANLGNLLYLDPKLGR